MPVNESPCCGSGGSSSVDSASSVNEVIFLDELIMEAESSLWVDAGETLAIVPSTTTTKSFVIKTGSSVEIRA